MAPGSKPPNLVAESLMQVQITLNFMTVSLIPNRRDALYSRNEEAAVLKCEKKEDFNYENYDHTDNVETTGISNPSNQARH